MRKIIINGANGYVASNFIVELLKKDYKVVALARSNKKCTAEERMKNALLEMNDGETLNVKNLEVYNYSLFEENFAMTDEQLSTIFGGEVDYFHFAASLKFDIKSKEEIFGTNLQGVTNSVNIFQKYTQTESRFFFVSTAYSCGRTEEVFEENRKQVYSFARANPIRASFSNTIVFSTTLPEGKTSPFASLTSIPLAPFRAIEGVDRTATAVNRFSDKAARFTDVVEELPE